MGTSPEQKSAVCGWTQREGAQTAFVSYRNRVTEVNVPPPDEFPAWES